MKSGNILVIGGYGSVGKIVSKTLAQKYPGKVIAAGRNIRKAEELSQEAEGKVLPLALDVFDLDVNIETILSGVSQVIMCLDQPDTHLVEQIIRSGVNYIDVTASSRFLRTMETLDDLAKSSNSTVVLSVGLVPGISNLLAAHAVSILDEIEHMDIFVMLGMGDTHGDAAVRWTLDNVNANFTVLEYGVEKFVRSFEDGKRTSFPGVGKRTAYRFNFPDQHTLPKTLGINSVSSRLCFDLEIAAKAFVFLKKTGLLLNLNRPRVKNIFVQALKKLHFGSNQFAIKVESVGRKNGGKTKYASTVCGTGEAHMTGLVAAQVAHRLYIETYPSGIFHVEQLFELESMSKKWIQNNLLEITHKIL